MPKKKDIEQLGLRIEEIYKQYYQTQIDTLVQNAAAAHAEGDLKAQAALKIKLSFDLVNAEAAAYAKAYRNELINKGGCTIQGKFVPWLKDRSQEDREEIARIIQEGYMAGTTTGVKAGKLGGYPKGSIAAQLSEYFQARKSHASMVARTEIARIQHHGSMTRYKKQQVKKGLWLVFEPCPICERFNRRVFALTDLPYEIPVHPHCRCALAPVPDDIPEGPAPKQEIPPVFETQKKALPYKTPGEQLQPIHHDKILVEARPKSADWEYYSSRYRDDKNAFSEEEYRAIERYCGSGYGSMNSYLRKGEEGWLDYHAAGKPAGDVAQLKANLKKYTLDDWVKPAIKNLDAVLARETIKEDVLVFRGCGSTTAKALLDFGKLEEKGYMSVTTKCETAVGFSSPGRGGFNDILVFDRKAGSPGLYIDRSESEIILPRGGKYELIGVRTVDSITDTDDHDVSITRKIRLLFIREVK